MKIRGLRKPSKAFMSRFFSWNKGVSLSFFQFVCHSLYMEEDSVSFFIKVIYIFSWLYSPAIKLFYDSYKTFVLWFFYPKYYMRNLFRCMAKVKKYKILSSCMYLLTNEKKLPNKFQYICSKDKKKLNIRFWCIPFLYSIILT